MNKKGFILPLAIMAGSVVIVTLFAYFSVINRETKNTGVEVDKVNPPSINELPYDYPLLAVSVLMTTVNPQQYHNNNICLFGYYGSSPQGQNFTEGPGSDYMGVDITFADSTESIKKEEECKMWGLQEYCSSWLTICGLLVYGENEYGDLNMFDFAILETGAKSWYWDTYIIPELSEDYLEVEEVLANQKAYLNQTIKLKGHIMRSQTYHSLVSDQAVEDGVVYGRDLLIEYDGNLAAEYINAGGTYKQTTVNDPPGFFVEGVLKDKGENSGIFRYYLDITNITSLNPLDNFYKKQ